MLCPNIGNGSANSHMQAEFSEAPASLRRACPARIRGQRGACAARDIGAVPQGSAAKPSPKPARSTGMPMPSSGVWKTMKVADLPVFKVSRSGFSRITSA